MRADEVLKEYLADDARYADLINGMVFDGRQVVKPEDLSEMDSQMTVPTTEAIIGNGPAPVKEKNNRKSSKPIYRDLIRRTAFGVNFAVVAVENQSLPHYLMPLRVMDYDVRQYRKQAKVMWKEVQTLTKPDKAEYLSHFLKSDRLHPCVTLVLFYGEDWDGSRDLHGMLDFTDIPKELHPLVNNYRINLLEIRKLEQTDAYRTDIKQVFDFIRYSKNEVKLRELVQNDPGYQHIDSDAYDVIAEFTKAQELIAIKDDYKVKEDVNMCEALTKMLQDERAEGREEGLEWGIEQGTLITLYALVQKGRLTLVEAAEEVQMSPRDFEAKAQLAAKK